MKHRLGWIDQLRGFMFFLVLLGHGVTYTELNRAISSFHMPMFFVISGLVLNPDKIAEKPLLAQIGHKFKSIMVPYYWITFAMFPFWIINYRLLRHSKLKLSQILIGNLVSNSQIAPATANPLWFVGALFFAYVYMILICRISGKNKHLRFLMTAAAMAMGFALKDLVLPYHLNAALVGCGYLYFGYLVRRYLLDRELLGDYRQLTAFLLLSAGAVCAYSNKTTVMMQGNYYNIPLFLGSSFCLSLALILLFEGGKEDRMLRFLGQNTMFALGAHMMIYRAYEVIGGAYMDRLLFRFSMVFFMQAVLAAAAVVLNRFWPYLNAKSTEAEGRAEWLRRCCMVCWCLLVPLYIVVRHFGPMSSAKYLGLGIGVLVLGSVFTWFASRYMKWVFMSNA